MILQIDGIEYLKLLTMMVIVSSCYYEKGVFQQSSKHDPKKISLAKRLLPSLSTFWIALRSLCQETPKKPSWAKFFLASRKQI